MDERKYEAQEIDNAYASGVVQALYFASELISRGKSEEVAEMLMICIKDYTLQGRELDVHLDLEFTKTENDE